MSLSGEKVSPIVGKLSALFGGYFDRTSCAMIGPLRRIIDPVYAFSEAVEGKQKSFREDMSLFLLGGILCSFTR